MYVVTTTMPGMNTGGVLRDGVWWVLRLFSKRREHGNGDAFSRPPPKKHMNPIQSYNSYNSSSSSSSSNTRTRCVRLNATDPIGKLRGGQDQAGELRVAEPDSKILDRYMNAGRERRVGVTALGPFELDVR